LEKDKAVSFTWLGRDDPSATEVDVILNGREGETHVAVEHCGLGVDAAWERATAELRRGWESSLENLASVLETGEDLRFTKRPMLGVFVGDFNADIAARLGMPVTEGVRLDGVVEGMGAAAAGLRQGDVVVSIAGHEVTDWPSLQNALAQHRAGDTVDVVFYRGVEKRTTQMPLSGRPIPEIPANPAAMAGMLQRRYEQNNADLEAFVAGITEEEASHRPAAGEWSVKDVLSHLIHSERGFQTFTGDVVGGEEGWYDDWGGNLDVRNVATVAAFPTVRALVDELKAARAETVAMIAALPESFLARKGSYWRLGYNVADNSGDHQETHLGQMRAAIENARDK
jgi:membrane-associated protease RseP (regulator of RpoE activity)